MTAFSWNDCVRDLAEVEKIWYINYKELHLWEEGEPHYVDVTSSVSFSLLIISFILS